MAYTSFMRGDNTKMTNTPYTDGLIFLNTEEQALYLDDNNERIPMGGAGTGGHIIENNAGTDMTERTNLQFGGVYVSDDETNDRTKVNITRNMTKDTFDQLTTAEKLGVIVTSNDPNDYVPFSADMVEYDNTTSGLTATNAQDAIDELNSDMVAKDITSLVTQDVVQDTLKVLKYKGFIMIIGTCIATLNNATKILTLPNTIEVNETATTNYFGGMAGNGTVHVPIALRIDTSGQVFLVNVQAVTMASSSYSVVVPIK